MDDPSSPRPRPRSVVGGSEAAGDFGASMTDFFRSLRGQGGGGGGLPAAGGASDGHVPGGGGSPSIPPLVPSSSEFRTPSDSRWTESGARDHHAPP